MKSQPRARPPVTCRRRGAKYCRALGSFISIRSIKAHIYQDPKQLPLLTTSTLFSHSLRCIRAKKRGGEAAFNAIYTWRHNSIKGPVLLKKQGLIWLYWQEREPLCSSSPRVLASAIQTRREGFLKPRPSVRALFFLFKLTVYEERKRLSAKTVTTLIICTTIFAIRHSK